MSDTSVTQPLIQEAQRPDTFRQTASAVKTAVADSSTDPINSSADKAPPLSLPGIPHDNYSAQALTGSTTPPPLPFPLPPDVDLPRVQEPDVGNEPIDVTTDNVTAVLTSATTISFFSSVTFHLLMLLTVVVVSPWLGFEWLKLSEESQPPLLASLGDEEISGEAPQIEIESALSDEEEAPASPAELLARDLQRTESGMLMVSTDEVFKNVVGGEAKIPDGSGSSFLLKIPESGLAVTKGSFTAFTIPANPKQREVYSIVIEIRLPNDVKQFRVTDLVGFVRGSDGYTQKLPFDTRAPYAAGYPGENQKIKVLNSSTILDVVDNRVQIVVKVPGAARLVKDTIKIRSKKLREEQELTLVFGVGAGSNAPDESEKIPGVPNTSDLKDEDESIPDPD